VVSRTDFSLRLTTEAPSLQSFGQNVMKTIAHADTDEVRKRKHRDECEITPLSGRGWGGQTLVSSLIEPIHRATRKNWLGRKDSKMNPLRSDTL